MTRNIIIHGDSREHLPKIKTPINLWLTDPPYGMEFESNQAQSPEGKKYTSKIEGDGNVHGAILTFHSIAGPVLAKMADDADIYIFTAWHVLDHWMAACRDLAFVNPGPDFPVIGGHDGQGKTIENDSNLSGYGGWLENHWTWDNERNIWVPHPLGPPPRWNIELKMMIVWEKGDPGMGDLKGNWGCGHEVCLYLKKGRRPVHHRRPAVIHVDKVPTGKNIHPTEKPQKLLTTLIEMSTDPGDLIVDTYSGSGSTSLAAKNTGRNSLAFEIDEQYIASSRGRLEGDTLFS